MQRRAALAFSGGLDLLELEGGGTEYPECHGNTNLYRWREVIGFHLADNIPP